MHPKNKYESKKVDKKCKKNHVSFGGDYPQAGRIHSNYRSPRHQWRSKGDRIKETIGCYCCTRSTKSKYIERLKEKKVIKNELKMN
jgi:3'-phosphoadenosine 5'-phosphosulfate sulfotransferase (PAPS reductase)/FAD synthetase